MATGVQTATGRFVWHDMNSTDVERAKAFYTELFGWGLEIFKPGEMDYPMISANGQMHGGISSSQGGAPSHWLGHVVVDDVDAAGERAKAAGGTIVAGPMDVPEVGRILVLSDPQGATISAYQPEGDSPVAQGVFVWDELYTADVDGAKTFYMALFGWDPETTDMGTGEYTIFRSGDAQVAGCMAVREEGVPSHWYPYIGTPDVDATTAKAKELGAQVYLEPTEMEGIGKFSVLGDPTGATFGLFQIPGQ
jgi:predicted enzyme related to lactoylglutathione lyase